VWNATAIAAGVLRRGKGIEAASHTPFLASIIPVISMIREKVAGIKPVSHQCIARHGGAGDRQNHAAFGPLPTW
jgi:hypothetical protein